MNVVYFDEPYCYSPACGPNEIVLEGSDTEESLEETRAKRGRYEEQAKRCTNGYLPIILSATLKGPFDKASGWENPWAYRPRNPPMRTQEEDWWKPGSEDMMFTRENVLKRAADHGLGWMTPAAALQWCKAAATAEAEATIGFGTNTMESISSFDTFPSVSTGGLHSTVVGIQPRQVSAPTEPSLSTIKPRRTIDDFIKATKRPLDSGWLKGLYISKRGRWDEGPPVPSPTPLPEMCRRSNATKLTESTTFQSLAHRGGSSIPRRRLSQQGRSSRRVPTGCLESAEELGRKSHYSLLIKSEHQRGNQISKPAEGHCISMEQEARNGGEELEEPQDSISAVSFFYGSTINSGAPGTPSNVIDILSSNSKSDFEFCRPEQDSPRDVGNISQNPTSNNFALKENSESLEEASFITEVVPSCRDLEKFQYRKRRSMFQQKAKSFGLGSSSVKRKVKPPSLEPKSITSCNAEISHRDEYPEEFDEEWETTIGANDYVDSDKESLLVVPKSGKRSHTSTHQVSLCHLDDLDQDDGDDEWEITIGEHDQVSPVKAAPHLNTDPSGTNMSYDKSSPKIMAVVPKKLTPPPKSECSNSSWDVMDDIANSSVQNVVVTSLAHSLPPNSHQVERQKGLVTKSPILSNQSAPGSKLSTLLKQSSPYPTQGRRSVDREQVSQAKPVIKSSALKLTNVNDLKVDEMIDQNDISTQSANTTPTRSLKLTEVRGSYAKSANVSEVMPTGGMIILEGVLKGEEPDERMSCELQSSHSYDQAEESEQHEMSQIQMALSQNYLSTNSQESDSSSRDISQEDMNLAKQIDTMRSKSNPSLSQPSEARVPDESPKMTQKGITHTCSKEARTSSYTSPSHPSIPTKISMDDALAEKERNLTETPNVHHEPSWRSSEPQSPWADDDVLPPQMPTRVTTPLQTEVATLYVKDEEPVETDWEQYERSLLAQNDHPTTLLKTLVTPVRFSGKNVVKVKNVDQITMSQEDTTTLNPWTSSLKNKGSKKSKKRVSFGFALAEEHTQSTQLRSSIIEPPGGDYSPSQTDPLNDGIPPPRPISILNTVATQRTFKRILPDKTASQLNSSPAPIEAMAEAFIAADTKAPMRQGKSSPEKSKNQSPQLNRISPWSGEDLNFPESTDILHETTLANDFMNTFDMADALGDAQAFLEDWSVETDLKKSRESDMRGHESNGMKRRRLFGIV